MRSEIFALMLERGYFKAQKMTWWLAQVYEMKRLIKGMENEIAGVKVANQKKVTNSKKVMSQKKARGTTALGMYKKRKRDDSSESDHGDDDESEEGEVDFDKLDRTIEEEMMEFDEAELTDEGIEDVSSDEELYGSTDKFGMELIIEELERSGKRAVPKRIAELSGG
jgi:hypothetical protein